MEPGNVQPAPPAVAPAPAPVKKGGGAAKVFCVLFALIALGLGGYIVADKTILNDSTKKDGDGGNVTNCKTEVDEDDKKEIVGKKIGYEYVDDFYGAFYITKDGDVYFEPKKAFGYSYDSDAIDWEISKTNNVMKKESVKIEISDLLNYGVTNGSDDPVEFEGYKIDLKNIQIVAEVEFGQQKNNASTAFIDKDGSLSMLVSNNVFENDGKAEFKLFKDIYSNVASVGVSYMGTGYQTVVYFRDGSIAALDDKYLDID